VVIVEVKRGSGMLALFASTLVALSFLLTRPRCDSHELRVVLVLMLVPVVTLLFLVVV
jgi:hypothetical protein